MNWDGYNKSLVFYQRTTIMSAKPIYMLYFVLCTLYFILHTYIAIENISTEQRQLNLKPPLRTARHSETSISTYTYTSTPQQRAPAHDANYTRAGKAGQGHGPRAQGTRHRSDKALLRPPPRRQPVAQKHIQRGEPSASQAAKGTGARRLRLRGAH